MTDIAIRSGQDQSIPFWHLQTRNDAHELILNALVETEVNLNENGPIALLGGNANETAATALCLWAEAISARRVPGLILVNTSGRTLQDTALGGAISLLGLNEFFAKIRVIDAREKTLPVSIHATPRGWARVITGLLSAEDEKAFESTGALHLFEQAAMAYGAVGRWVATDDRYVPFEVIEKAARLLVNLDVHAPHLIEFLSEPDRTSLVLDIKRYKDYVLQDGMRCIQHIIESMSGRGISLGRLLWQESLHRPTVVVFNQNDQASAVIAGAVHEMYYWRHVRDRSVRPIFYFSDDDPAAAAVPRMLCFGTETVIANGSLSRDDPIWQRVTMNKAQFGEVANGALSFSARRAPVVKQS